MEKGTGACKEAVYLQSCPLGLIYRALLRATKSACIALKTIQILCSQTSD